MMKKILSVLLVLCLCAALGACKKEGVDTSTVSVESGSTSLPGRNDPSSDPVRPSSQQVAPGKMGEVSKQYAEILASGKYRLQFDVVMGEEDKSVESKYDMAVSDGKTYSKVSLGRVGNQAQQEAMSIITITKDGKKYDLTASNKVYMESTLGINDTGAIDANGLAFTEKGEEDGATYEEYTTAGGGTIRFFVKDGKLVRITSAAERLTLEMTNVVLTKDVPDSIFEIPGDYKKVE